MVILKYHEWLRIQPDYRSTIYELCDDEFKKKRQISKEEAIELIREHNLQRVHRNMHGAIWKS
jgi:hypothetical protein